MINENDLRRGNLIYGISDRIEKVMALREGLITAFTPTSEDNAMEFESKYFSPIELTEDWLIRFEFKKTVDEYDDIYYALGNFILEEMYFSNLQDCGFYYHLGHNELKIHSVDQLQNLFWAVTGEELTIKTI